MKTMKKNGLVLDPDQGTTPSGQTFGFIGIDCPDPDEYQGWFFFWPGARPGIENDAEANAVMDSMVADSESRHCPQVDEASASEFLREYLTEEMAKNEAIAQSWS